ncbi:MAG: fibronectin type III domain-containing protein [Pseudomonas sp.]|uniref:fibronectin type III domain-containing protein n=1 Tax=Pseudomonas sp. TaxID=306 RepID=UPI003D6E726B
MTTKSVTHSPCEITALKHDTEYLFHVTAKAAGNNVSDVSSCRLFKLQVPGKPDFPKLLNATSTSLSVCWAATNPGFEGTRYRVYLNGFLVTQVTEPQVSLTHLQSHTDYRVDVRAVNDAGISEPRGATFKTRLRTPGNLRFSQRNGLCRLAWNPVFKQFPSHEISINDRVFTTLPGRWGFNFRLADVSSGTAPHHLKFAVHARQDGETSDVALFETTVADDIPPARPVAPIVIDITDIGATLNWEPSSDVDVSGYEVILNGVLVFPTLNTHFTFTKLTSGAYHWVAVRARDNEGNTSGYSPISVFKTTGQAPSPKPPPPVVSITALTSTSARMEWRYQDNFAYSGARIMINEEHFADVLLMPGVVLQNLTPDTEYSISVSTFDVYGQISEPTLLVHEPRDVTTPTTPANLRAADVTADTVTLKWEASNDDVGISEYVIYNNREYFDSTPLLEYLAVDLLPGIYQFEVCAIDLSGNASSPAALNVGVAVPLFSAPRNLRFRHAGLISILEWNAPVNMGSVSRYHIVLTGPNADIRAYEVSLPILRPLLFPRTRYEVNITAVNENGYSLPLITQITTY